jgi:hypothetical protein
MNAKLCVYGPIPAPSDWIIASEDSAPLGYLHLCSLNVSRRSPAKMPGSDLVAVKDIQSLPSDVERLLAAYARCDAASRTEIIAIAERLASTA